MFDMGFFELLVVAIVGLFVIGPERLPHTVRTVALWIGRIKRSIMETRREIEAQIGADEIRRELHNEQVMRNWEKMKDVRAELEAKINAMGKIPELGEPTAPPPSLAKPADNMAAVVELEPAVGAAENPAVAQTTPASQSSAVPHEIPTSAEPTAQQDPPSGHRPTPKDAAPVPPAEPHK